MHRICTTRSLADAIAAENDAAMLFGEGSDEYREAAATREFFARLAVETAGLNHELEYEMC